MDKSLADVDEIANVVKKDRTTVYRVLKGLNERGLVVRECRILRGGGYKYIYRPVPIEDLKAVVIKRMEIMLKELASKHQNDFFNTHHPTIVDEEGARDNLGDA